MTAAIEAMRTAFRALSEGRAQVPPRASLSQPDGVTLVMPGAIEEDAGAAAAVKVVSVFPVNKEQGLPAIHGLMLVIDPASGKPAAVLDGGALTAIRTAAVCGLATDLLARSDCTSLAVIGSGVQARTQAEAVCTVRPIERVVVCNPNLAKAERAAAELCGRGPIPGDVAAAASAAEALRGADVICTATTSRQPVLADRDVPPGVHINAIGSFQPHVRELPAETVARSLLVVDEKAAAFEEAGDILQAIATGAIQEDHIHCELGELVLGRARGRSTPEQITLFKSVGLAVQDVAAAQSCLREAERRGLGRSLEW